MGGIGYRLMPLSQELVVIKGKVHPSLSCPLFFLFSFLWYGGLNSGPTP
jgi:hypothetical protein